MWPKSVHVCLLPERSGVLSQRPFYQSFPLTSLLEGWPLLVLYTCEFKDRHEALHGTFPVVWKELPDFSLL